MYKLYILFLLIICSKAYDYSTIPLIAFIDNCQLPKECNLVEKIDDKIDYASYRIICYKLRSTINLDNCNLETKKNTTVFKPIVFFLTLIGKIEKNYILNNDITLYKMAEMTKKLMLRSSIAFENIKGFNANFTLELKVNVFSVTFLDTNFDFYNQYNGKLITSCQEYKKSIGNLTKNVIFNSLLRSRITLAFSNSQFKTPVCSLVFQNAKLLTFNLQRLVKSYYKKNTISFLKELNNNSTLNSDIYGYSLENFYGLDLDSKLIDLEIFNKTVEFKFYGVINSIQADLFKNFKNLRNIGFNPKFLLDLVRKQGTDWIKSINYDMDKVNLNNPSESMKDYMEKSVQISFSIKNAIDYLDGNIEFFYEQDFCLMKNFPFDQLVIFNIYISFLKNAESKISDLSCTTLWLVQYYPIYLKYSKSNFLYRDINKSLSVIKNKSCDFETRLKMCNRSNFKFYQTISTFDFMIITQLLVVIFTQLVCVFGIVTNMLIILTVVYKKNRKELKENQYTYMAINSASNILILFIQILSLMNECQSYPFGIFCSSIRKYPFVQYFKIVVGETVSAFLRLFSNFTYLAFLINRLSLVGVNNSDFIEYFSKLPTYKYLIFSSIFSSLISLVKGFRYRFNSFQSLESYPLIFHRNAILSNHRILILSLIFAFDAIYNLINYIIFTIIHFVLDILLFYKMRKTIKEKEVKYKTIYLLIDSQYSKKLKENQETIRRVLKMVILTALVSFACKLPISFTSLNDLRVLVSTGHHEDFDFNFQISSSNLFRFPFSLKTICYFDESCKVFENFGNFLFLISLVVNFFFFYKFDKKFRLSFKIAFGRNVLATK